jgi:phosphatidylserine/phosphatidylglycerophosphate/cardiolipin synthase-like enzyme
MDHNSDGSIKDPFAPGPPALLKYRCALVQTDRGGDNPLDPMVNTIVIPHDTEDPAGEKKWFLPIEGRPIRSGNEVKYLVSGKNGSGYTQPAFVEIAKAIVSAEGPRDFIYLIAWYLDHNVVLAADEAAVEDCGQADGDPPPSLYIGKTVGELLQSAGEKGVEIRALFAPIPGFVENTKTSWLINGLKTGAASIDAKVAHVLLGTHHQKIVSVYAKSKLTALCGGVDMNWDRLRVMESGRGQPLHDVHCRIRGLAAYDLLRVFIDRWEDMIATNSQARNVFGEQRSDLLAKRIPASFEKPGKMTVQITRTHGHLLMPYQFAPKGDRSIFRMIENAIKHAERFIYFEDQYMVDADISRLIAERLDACPSIQHVTILISHNWLSDLPGAVELRKEFMKPLQKYIGNKVRIFSLCNPDASDVYPDGDVKLPLSEDKWDQFFENSYVHAKVWIFDDEFAVIGSANCNNRGMNHDSEVAAGIYDPSRDDQLTYRFAHRLRIRIWAKHLNLNTQEGYAELADGVASAVHWLHPPPGARIIEFTGSERSKPALVGDRVPKWAADPVSD